MIKRCPRCGRAYDETLFYCLDDGSPLSAQSDLEKTWVITEPHSHNPPPTVAYPATESTEVPQPAKKSHLRYAVALILVGLSVAAGIFIFYRANQQQSITFPDQTRYEGGVRDGQPHGRGIMVFPHGDVYDGEFRDGKRNGRGTYTFRDGTKYVGEFGDDEYNGRGVLTYPDGTRQEGTWVNGTYSGP
jgi:hypothetical protein